MPKGIYERKKRSVEDRFWKKVDIKGPSDCWEWKSSKTKLGYGRFSYTGNAQKAHRIAWLLCYGKIPENMEVCHQCDNPGCVNPDHLFLGTHKENMYDSIKKGRSKLPPCLIGEAHANSKLTEVKVIEIRKEYKTGKITQRRLATKYKISQGAIWHIVNRKLWVHI